MGNHIHYFNYTYTSTRIWKLAEMCMVTSITTYLLKGEGPSLIQIYENLVKMLFHIPEQM